MGNSLFPWIEDQIADFASGTLADTVARRSGLRLARGAAAGLRIDHDPSGLTMASGTGASAPLRVGTLNRRIQWVVRASELTAMGLVVDDTLHGISLRLGTTTAARDLARMGVSLKTTTIATLGTTFDDTGLTTVVDTAVTLIGVTAGTWLDFDFSSPFTWDGNHLLVDVIVNQTATTTSSGSNYAWAGTGRATGWSAASGTWPYAGVAGTALTTNSAPQIKLRAAAYQASGTRIKSHEIAGEVIDTHTRWAETLPTGTSIVVEAAVNASDVTPPDPVDWEAQTNGQPLTVIAANEDVTGKYLWVRQTLATSDTDESPTLTSCEVLREYVCADENLFEDWTDGHASLLPIADGKMSDWFAGQTIISYSRDGFYNLWAESAHHDHGVADTVLSPHTVTILHSDQFERWTEGQTGLIVPQDGTFDDWYGGQPVILYKDSGVANLSVESSYHESVSSELPEFFQFNDTLQMQGAYHESASENVALAHAGETINIFTVTGDRSTVTQAGGNHRYIFSVTGLFPNHDMVRIKLRGPLTIPEGRTTQIDNSSIGPRKDETDDYSAAPTPVTFDGEDTYELAADEEKWSDWIRFTPPASGFFMVHLYYHSNSVAYSLWNDDKVRYYYAVLTDLTDTQTVNLFTGEDTRTIESIEFKEYVPEVLGAQNIHHEHAAQAIALTQSHELIVASAYNDHVADQVRFDLYRLIVANSHHVHEAQAPSLTQAHTLGIAGGTHEQTAQPLSLSGTQSLVVASGVHEHFSEGLDIAVLYLMTVAACYHVHDGPNLALTQDHTLSAANASHEQQAPNIVIVTIISLFVDGCAHNHAAEAMAVFQSHTLVVQDAFHESGADTTVVIEDHYPLTQGVAHGTHSDTLALTGIHYLLVDSTIHVHSSEHLSRLGGKAYLAGDWVNHHGHTAGSIVLDQSHRPTVADCYHGHTAGEIAFFQHHIVRPHHCYHGHVSQNVVFAAIAQVRDTQLFSLTPKLTLTSATAVQANHKAQLFSLTPKLTLLKRTDRTSIERWNGSTRIAA